MPDIFSFIQHPIDSMLKASVHLIPGVEKCTALYGDPVNQQIQCKGLVNQENSEIQEFLIQDWALASKLRKKKFQFQWMRADQLPFETVQTNRRQLNIFDETENIVLALAFENSSDQQSDLLFLYLSKNLSSFGLSNSTNTLSTTEKSIIGAMAYNSFTWQLNKNQNDRETLQTINLQVRQLQGTNEQLENEIQYLRKSFQQRVIEMCQEHLQKLSGQYNLKFELDKSAIKKLNGFVGNIEQLKVSLTKAVQMAINLNFGSTQNTIVLKAWDIPFESAAPQEKPEVIPNIQERYQKTFLLLEKLEHAARVVVNNRERLTSENVGNACPTPISAPAISDALKNHHKKVIRLLQDYPEMWPTIRNEFRPIRNILNNQQAVS